MEVAKLASIVAYVAVEVGGEGWELKVQANWSMVKKYIKMEYSYKLSNLCSCAFNRELQWKSGR